MSPTVASTPPAAQTLHSPPITIVLTVVLLLFFLLGFFSIYFCRCIMGALFHTWHLRRSPSGNLGGSGVLPAHSGLDPALIKSLPTFLYSSVKDARKEKYGLECAICLAEFRDDSLLRLLTACCHVFHQECVDLWLESHKTCPVCRRDLDSPAAKPSPENPQPAADLTPPTNDVTVDVNDVEDDDDDDDDDEGGDSDEDVIRRRFYQNQYDEDDKKARVRVCSADETAAAGGGGGGVGERFTRSHSTGHSIVKVRSEEEEDRYTLKLPDHVRMRILRARHWSESCETYGDFERHRFAAAATTACDSSSGFLGDVSGSIGSNN